MSAIVTDMNTYALDIHLMTSRELTSGFHFWSSGHLRMAVMHLPIKFGVDIYIQSRVIYIFPKFRMAAAAILDFQFYVNLAIPACWQCGICVLYQICFKYLL